MLLPGPKTQFGLCIALGSYHRQNDTNAMQTLSIYTVCTLSLYGETKREGLCSYGG